MSKEMRDSVNITRVITEAPFSAFLVSIIVLCGAVAFLDGLDSTSIGLTAPLIILALKLSPAHLGPIFSAAIFGAMLGALSFGSLGDRFGRKRMLVIATLLFAAFTIATAFVASFESLIAIRFLAGIGLGGAVPCFIALASEYAPNSHRAMVTSFVWAAYPTGGILGAFLNAWLLSRFGWHSIFVVGGGLAMLAFLALILWLPESIRFLLVKNRNSRDIHRIAGRIVPGLNSNEQIITSDEQTGGAPFKNLFINGEAVRTVLLWIPFVVLSGTASGVLWIPSLMHEHGISLPKASIVLGISGIGSIFGAASAGRLMEKFGAVAILAPAMILGGLSTAVVGYFAGSLDAMLIDVIFLGTCVGGLSAAGLLALAAVTYPISMRSTGLGWASGIGRLGQVIVPLLTSLALLHHWQLSEVYVLLGISMIIGAGSVIMLQRQTDRQKSMNLPIAKVSAP